jgi:transcription antitermination factor NusG
LNWYAIYTLPRAEKKTYAELVKKGIETYLPLERSLKQWSDRKKWVEEPLFRSYIFVNISQGSYFDVLNTTGVVRYITFEGKAVPIPEKQIEAIRYFLAGESINSYPADSDGMDHYTPGTFVEVIKGPLTGISGELVQVAGRHKVRVEISAVGQSILVTIPISQLRVLK